MFIIPAIDLRGGKCVRLIQGKLEQETVYSDDPVAVAKTWQSRGARMMHLVDLDGAFAGESQNLEVVKKIIQAVDIPVQLGGGIRTLEKIEEVLILGVSRVILGTVAVTNPELVVEACRLFPGQIAVGIDSKSGMVAVDGWGKTAVKKAVDLAKELKQMGVEWLIYTDISKDGMLSGPNLEATREIAAVSTLKVIASGGVSSVADILALSRIPGVAGVIVGKALYTGAVRLEEALAAVEGVEAVAD